MNYFRKGNLQMRNNLIHWLEHWLPIIFGCHQRPDRSFFYKGKQLPLCARCTGEFIGIFFSFFLFLFVRPHFFVCFLLCIPLVVDGFAQKLTSYESTNAMRLLTGFLFGIGLVGMFWSSTSFVYNKGYWFGLRFVPNYKAFPYL